MPAHRLSRRFGWFVLLLGLLLWPRAGYANQQIYADFDGDGYRDRASFDPADASSLRIWLSGSQQWRTLHSRQPLVQLTALDLNGDGRSELVAADHSGLRIWTAGRGDFRSLHERRRTRPHAGRQGPGRTLDEDPGGLDDSSISRSYGQSLDIDATTSQFACVVSTSPAALPADSRLLAHQPADDAPARAPPVSGS